MNVDTSRVQRGLRFSGILLILGLGVELTSLLWEKPIAFILFAFVGGTLLIAGILVYLYSLVSTG